MFLRFHSEISLLILVVRFKKLWCTIIARTCAAGRAFVRNHGEQSCARAAVAAAGID